MSRRLQAFDWHCLIITNLAELKKTVLYCTRLILQATELWSPLRGKICLSKTCTAFETTTFKSLCVQNANYKIYCVEYS